MTTPDLKLTMLLLSTLVHADEFMDHNPPTSHAGNIDREAFKAGMNSPDVMALLAEYDKASMIPVRRDDKRYTP